MTLTVGTLKVIVDTAETGIGQRLNAVAVLNAGFCFQRNAVGILPQFAVVAGVVGELVRELIGVIDVFVDGRRFLFAHVDIDAAERVDNAGKSAEIDGNIVLDIHLKVFIDRTHGQSGAEGRFFIHAGRFFRFGKLQLIAAILERDVDLVFLLVSGKGNIGIAQDGGHFDLSGAFVDGENDLGIREPDDVLLDNFAVFVAGDGNMCIHTEKKDVQHVIRELGIEIQRIGIHRIIHFRIQRKEGFFLLLGRHIELILDTVGIFGFGAVVLKDHIFLNVIKGKIVILFRQGKHRQEKGQGKQKGKDFIHGSGFLLCGVVQFIQRHIEGRQEVPQEIMHLGKVDPVQRFPDILRRVIKLAVAGALLLQTFDIGADLVGCLDDVAAVAFLLLQIGGEGGLHLRREKSQEPVGGKILQTPVGASKLIAVILDGRGEVAGHDLGGIVIDSQGKHMLRIDAAPVAVPADDGDRMGDHRDLQGMLRVVFLLGVSHEGPAGDQAEAGKIRKKRITHEVHSSSKAPV